MKRNRFPEGTVTLISQLEDRFLRYVQIDTQSDELSAARPTTAGQMTLLRLLERELVDLGATDVVLDDVGWVLATIPAMSDAPAPRIALFAHVDTAPAYPGENVQPLVHRNYSGRPIVLPDDPAQILDPAERPYLAQKKGHDIVTASGTTILGADDKAGVAILMTLADHLLSNPPIPHGEIRLCFTTDEEVGYGTEGLDLAVIDADFGYTLDGGEVGELTFETFSADKAIVTIDGISTHTGTARGQMVNALTLAAKFVTLLPESHRTPETTDGRDGFIHLYKIDGSAAHAELYFLLRDFERDGLEAHRSLMRSVVTTFRTLEPRAKVDVAFEAQYRNMRYWLENEMTPVDLARAALRQVGVTPIERPIRGGTDGSQLTEMGLPTPNLFTGMQDVHGPLEWVSLQDMELAVKTLTALLELAVTSRMQPVT